MQTQSDSLTYNRIFEEWNRIREALSGSTATEVDDPLGNDGLVVSVGIALSVLATVASARVRISAGR